MTYFAGNAEKINCAVKFQKPWEKWTFSWYQDNVCCVHHIALHFNYVLVFVSHY